MCKNINPFFSAAYPFSDCVWVVNQEDAAEVSRSIFFLWWSKHQDLTEHLCWMATLIPLVCIPEMYFFPGKGFTGKVECQWKERNIKTLICDG